MTPPLPPIDPSADDDKLPGEAELAALYRQLPQSEPGPALDAAVLRAAAQALEDTDGRALTDRRKGPREPGDWVHPKTASVATASPVRSIDAAARTRRQQTPRWLLGLGSAASLVLVAGLAWRMRESSPAASAPAALSTVAVDTASAPSTPARAALAPRALPPPAPPAARQVAGRLAAATADSAMKLEKGGQSRSAGVLASNNERRSAPPPPVAELAAPAPPQEPAKATRDYMAKVNQPATMMAAPAQAAMQAKPAAAPPADAAAEASVDKETARDPGDTPAQELGKIEQLYVQGRDAEAQQRLAAFRLAHPQWPLPPSLQARLPHP